MNNILKNGDEKVRVTTRLHHLNSYQAGLKPEHSEDGFTLVEVIIVVVILSIAAMIAVPMMSSAETFQLRSATSMLASDLEYAKNLAISKGQTISVVFDDGDDSYSLEDQTGTTLEHPVKKGFNFIIDFGSDGTFEKVEINQVNLADSILEFDSLGSPDEGGTVVLNAGGETLTVTIEPVTGYISVSD